jgi:3-oxoadipate CoA-transferase alpha subunit
VLYHRTARNFAPPMATAAGVTIVQVAEVVDAGQLDAESIVTPGIFVDRIVHVPSPQQESALIAAGARYP